MEQPLTDPKQVYLVHIKIRRLGKSLTLRQADLISLISEGKTE